MANRILFFAICSFCIVIAGCADYGITINQQPVYTRSHEVSVEGIADENLADCIRQTVADQALSSLSELKRLSCTTAGIEDLTGIEALEGLEELNLDNNALTHITPLQILGQLKRLQLRNNPDLVCADLEQLMALRQDALSVAKPEHCTET